MVILIQKELNLIDVDELIKLREHSVLESKTLDYKWGLFIEDKYSHSRESRREFLRDLCAFGNTDGGDLIVGVREDKGLPVEFSGMFIDDIDAFKLLCDNLITDGIEPTLSYDIATIELSENTYVVVFRVYKNMVSGPYRVRYKNENKFFGRQSSRNYELSLSDLRSRFNYSSRTRLDLDNLRERYVRNIYKKRLPVDNFISDTKLTIHIVPLNDGNQIPFESLDYLHKYLTPLDLELNDVQTLHNFDGYLAKSSNTEGKVTSYIQLYSNGVLEVVDASLLMRNEEYSVNVNHLEDILIMSMNEKYLKYIELMSFSFPVHIYCTFVNVKGYRAKGCARIPHSHPIERDVLFFEPIVIESRLNIPDAETLFKPLFNTLWRSFGLNREMEKNIYY